MVAGVFGEGGGEGAGLGLADWFLMRGVEGRKEGAGRKGEVVVRDGMKEDSPQSEQCDVEK